MGEKPEPDPESELEEANNKTAYLLDYAFIYWTDQMNTRCMLAFMKMFSY